MEKIFFPSSEYLSNCTWKSSELKFVFINTLLCNDPVYFCWQNLALFKLSSSAVTVSHDVYFFVKLNTISVIFFFQVYEACLWIRRTLQFCKSSNRYCYRKQQLAYKSCAFTWITVASCCVGLWEIPSKTGKQMEWIIN